ncbi:GNAT family N-acetyltransferase [Erythrobacter sp. HL-111]|uniref:GNAT family N-acetyltransferase n=1 Tax=Erythrobacter sp. HL-111 TaxID=1798193 RepID=UPI0006DBD63C|nr:GNAT family N-acetyltransferase [Erythrobacter sp. HL-111]KPP90130.1 MAG: putative acetyltransferase [Erythrobacteraceae bacterium HL-111]SDR81156.1 Acetyltransferase (GNAT) family protein [Erythrobacter sp. HL-111]
MIIDTQLNDGTPICIRTLRRDDEALLRAGIARLSPHSRYLRFFSGMREPPQGVIDKLLDVDGHDHIAWGAIRIDLAERPALGVVHAFRDATRPDRAEFSVAVIDDYHGLGLARLLTATLLHDCRREGLETLSVSILPENAGAIRLTRLLGGHRTEQFGGERGEVAEFDIDIDEALESLRRDGTTKGLAAVFEAFGRAD